MHDSNWKKMKKMLCKIKINKNVHIKKFKKLKIYFVYTGIFNFWEGRLEFTHAFSHSCLPFLDFWGQVMHFYKSPWVDLIDTS